MINPRKSLVPMGAAALVLTLAPWQPVAAQSDARLRPAPADAPAKRGFEPRFEATLDRDAPVKRDLQRRLVVTFDPNAPAKRNPGPFKKTPPFKMLEGVVKVLEPDLDGDGIPDAKDTDDDGDGLADTHEKAIGTNPRKRDTDGDGYTDYEEVTDLRLKNPPADYKTKGAKRADPLKRDIFIELDYLGPKKKKILWWTIKYCSHSPDGESLGDMVERFEENGFNVFICVDDKIPHKYNGKDREHLERSDIVYLRKLYRDYPIYYYCLYADEAGGALGKTGKFGHAWHKENEFVVFDGIWYMTGDLVAGSAMHELGHLLIDTAASNPAAAHLLSKPKEWDDGAHCPNNCVLNYASKLSLLEKLKQWWEFDYCGPCWNAVRGFRDKP